MEFDVVLLARAQFAFTIAFHIIFPSFTIGLAAFIATLLIRWRITGQEDFYLLARFWTKIFAVSFAMGVVSGIVLSYQIGTNWSAFSKTAGNVIGPLLGYEVFTAFFLEATFLGIMLFGWNRVSPNLHLASAILVAIGTSLSAFWILSANSWMHTPQGYEIRNGVIYPLDWFEIVFNPSFPYRFLHMFIAAYLTTSLVVLAVGARYRVRNQFSQYAGTMIHMGLGMVMLLAPLQLIVGDLHGLNTAKYQPAKIAAMEAHWDGSKPADLVLFALPNEEKEQNDFEISIPNLASWIITRDLNGLIPGLKDFEKRDRPPVTPVFFAFRIMVGLGIMMICIGIVTGWFWWRKNLMQQYWLLSLLQHVWPMGFIAILAGWWVTETGRQPWVIHEILRTKDAVSPVSASVVASSLIVFVVAYTIIFFMGIYYINRLIEKGPNVSVVSSAEGEFSARTISAATKATRTAIQQESTNGSPIND